MDYEKKYNEALERAKDFKNGIAHYELNPGESIVNWIFPELRENEDERIRTRLSEYFQGFLVGYEDCYKDGGCVKWEGMDVKSVLAWFEKQKDQKPVEGDNETEIQKAFREGKSAGRKEVFDHPEEYGLQKTIEWSEEDEMYLSQAIEVLEHENYLILADKLKSLRPSWRPSEEQMNSLRDTIIQTKGYSYSMYLPELYEQLKKL